MEFYQEIPRKGVICNYGITEHFKTGYLSVSFVMPLTVKNATGMSLLAGVMSRGCRAYPGMDLISSYLAKNYGASFSINAFKAGEMEILSLSCMYLDNAYAIDGEDVRGAIVSLIREMLFHPLVAEGGFQQDYVDQEKVNLADKITGLINDKRIYSLERCKALMCADEAYGISEMGEKDEIQSFDPHSLYEFYGSMMAEASVVITYVGKDRERFLSQLSEGFEARTAPLPETKVLFGSGEAHEVVEPMDLNQSKLNLGYRLGASSREKGAACRLFNVIYGGSATSKLFMNVRERLSLCYYCSSNIDRFKNVMFVSSGVEASKYEEARREIEAQLASVASGDFSEEEFENAKVYLIDSIRGFLDSESALASSMLADTLHGELKTPDREIEEISKVTREDVIAIAKETVLDTVYFLKGVHSEE